MPDKIEAKIKPGPIILPPKNLLLDPDGDLLAITIITMPIIKFDNARLAKGFI